MTYQDWNSLTDAEKARLPENLLLEIPQSELRNGLTYSKLIRKNGENCWEIRQNDNPSEIYPEYKTETVSGKPIWYKFDPIWGVYNMEVNPQEWEKSIEEEPIGSYGTAWLNWMNKHHKGKVLQMQLKHIFLTVARSVDKAAWEYRELLDSQYARMNPRPTDFEETVKWETMRAFYTDSAVMRERVLIPITTP